MDGLNETEQFVLLARLGEGAYGVTIWKEIEEQSRRTISVATVYNALGRLERRGSAVSSLSEATAKRGGRARRNLRITPAGVAALRESREVMERMWDGVRLAPEARG